MNTNTNIKNTIEDTIVSFLEDWDRHEWLRDHGTWASEEWNEARKAYEDAVQELREAVEDLDDPEYADPCSADDVARAVAAVQDAAKALDGQVRPDESDYIAEGLLDPDGVADKAEPCGVDCAWQGWDCREGWSAHRVGDALYLNWFRSAYGNRHDRDLWVLVDDEFFVEDND